MNKYTDKLEPGYFYHFYNRTVSSDLLFYNEENYTYFLKSIYLYLNDYIDFYAYCLLPNHFHFLIKVKEFQEQSRHDMFSKYVISMSEAFRSLFISYSKSINKQNDRKGSLFIRQFKRIKVENEKYLISLVYYIHFNPLHHEITTNIETYKWSSYNSLISNKPSNLKRDSVIEWFDDKENFIATHKTQKDISLIKHLLIDLEG